MSHPLIQIKNLYKSFGDTEVLKDVSIDINRGEVVSIIGPSGSGKTTLLRCINVLTKYDKGSIKIDNVEIGSEDFKNKEGRQIRVSTIDIHMTKNDSINVSKDTKELTDPVESPIEIVSSETKVEEPIVVADANEKPQQTIE